jgi:hypothetical protein
MHRNLLIALMFGFVALSTAACDKCGNFLGQPTSQPRACK